MPSCLAQRGADVVALGLEEREAHRAADQDRVRALEEGLQHADLVRHLGAADDRDERPLRVFEDAVERRHLALEQPARGAGQQVGDALGRGVRAVRGPERVVDIHVGQLRVALGQRCVVLGLALEEAHVLDHHDVALGHVVEVGRERDLDAEQLTQTLRGGLERELLVHALRPPEMREQDEPGGPLLAQLLQGRQRRPDACVVGDPAVLVLRDVEVHADEDALALDVEIVKRAHAPAPSGRGPRSGWSSPTRCRTR